MISKSTRPGLSLAAFVVMFLTFATLPVASQTETRSEPEDQGVQRPEAVRAKYLSFYGTGRSDWAVLTIPSLAGDPYVWKILKNQAGTPVSSTFNFGVFGDVVSPGSYTGDATFGPAVWRSNGAGVTGWTWIDPFENGAGTPYTVIPYATSGDNMGRNGDYDGDGIEDIAAIRITNSVLNWWIRLSSTGGTRVVPFGRTATGNSTYAFEGADFTGDGRDELILARSNDSSGQVTWYIGDAVTGAQLNQFIWGNFNTDYLINPADYTGDGVADYVVWRAGGTSSDARTWYIASGTNGQMAPRVIFGIGDPAFTNDIPVRGDYDGDGTDDIAVYRPSTNTFWVRASSNGTLIVQQWGAPGDTPLGNFFTF